MPKNIHYEYGSGTYFDEKIKLIIPILIKWAQTSYTEPLYYSTLAGMVGVNQRQVGDMLGLIWSHVIHPRFPFAPPLNAIVCSKSDDLPSDGLDYVYPDYSQKMPDEQAAMVRKVNEEAHLYDWNPVLKGLGLNALAIIPQSRLEKITSKSHFGKGGESEHHKKLKGHIKSHPESIGIVASSENGTIEYQLLSNDIIDVYFETPTDSYAVEVKSHISNDGDVLRGIFQSIKYKAILDAQNKVFGKPTMVHSILVLGRKLPKEYKDLVTTLNVNVIEDFII